MFLFLPTNDQDVLFGMLSHIKNTEKGVLKARTPVRMNKYDVETKSIRNPFVAVYKIATTKVEVNADYEQLVNNQRVVEGKQPNFEAGPLPWGIGLDNVRIEHYTPPKPYVKFIQEQDDPNPRYEDENGQPVNEDAIRPFMPRPNNSRKQGLNDPVRVRTYMLQHILELTLSGQRVFER